ncbi:lipocalin family protein [Mucilaginibacter sp. dw_454]|uniref:lipocalin family protein n=1 Tax=Mucilaginibacter sp. dw_454 TaxID=2720079 RepID=UPI001BD699CD|nr:lipocalin family protein [Mucilaginibacter sp. dw_454]
MKKLIPALLIGAAAIAGCKKDDQSSIIGKWKLTKSEIAFADQNGNVYKDTTILNTNTAAYIQFNSNNTGNANVGIGISIGAPNLNDINAGNFTYQLSGSALTVNFAQSSTPVEETVAFSGGELALTNKIHESSGNVTLNGSIVAYYSK